MVAHFVGTVESVTGKGCLVFNKTDASLIDADCSDNHGVACFSFCACKLKNNSCLEKYGTEVCMLQRKSGEKLCF